MIEPDWIETLPQIAEAEFFQYQDYVETANELVSELKDDGAQLIIALTHMREVRFSLILLLILNHWRFIDINEVMIFTSKYKKQETIPKVNHMFYSIELKIKNSFFTSNEGLSMKNFFIGIDSRARNHI